ncbi:MAG: hypothetical protein H7A25_07105 [Leptospiraceae bacterium]|nr:hypothetical protein [Leptospiraceae bacterium]MCP5499651.1 hypothetical protein [Leptospiraceae bacterium]
MKSLFHIFILIFSLFLFSSCSSRKDDSLEKSIFTFLISCTGGSKEACKNSCAGQCGLSADAVTNTLYPCVQSCHSNCDTVCDFSMNLMLYLNK